MEHFVKYDIWKTSKYLKKFSTVIGDMKIKTIMRCYWIPITMDKLKKQKQKTWPNQRLVKDMDSWNFYITGTKQFFLGIHSKQIKLCLFNIFELYSNIPSLENK